MNSLISQWYQFLRLWEWPSPLYNFLIISSVVLMLEWMVPWRKKQPRIRKDFWLDTFYMFFNLYLYPLLGFGMLAVFAELALQSGWQALGFRSIRLIDSTGNMPVWAQMTLFFFVRDFVQWNTHRLLHRIPFLWNFHKVHHSVHQMGYAAHLRYHPLENFFYRIPEFLVYSMVGFDFSVMAPVFLITLIIGHLNHANFRIPLGPLRYIFNNAGFHMWHHASVLPQDRRYGVNFALSLSLWDYIFRTNYQPDSGRDVRIGYPGDTEMPSGFIGQFLLPFRWQWRSGSKTLRPSREPE